jgi:uncharacterized membrane protein
MADRTPVLLIPGVYGTTLEKGSELLWLDMGRIIESHTDAFLDPIQLTDNLDPLDYSVRPGAVIGKTGIAGLAEVDIMVGLLEEFRARGYVVDGDPGNRDVFLFPYDWRLGVEPNVGELRQKINEIISLTGSPKIDIVAHSTGGLIAKRYVQLDADPRVGKVVFIGVPHLGAPKAINVLLTGDAGFHKRGYHYIARTQMRKLARNMPVVYDLMPSIGYYLRKGSFLQTISPSGEKQELDYIQTRELLIGERGKNGVAFDKAVTLHNTDFDNFDLRTKGVDVYNIVGCGGGENDKGTIGGVVERRYLLGGPAYGVRYTAGDGTVPIESALNTPTDTSKLFYALNADHGQMPSQVHVRRQVLNILAGDASDMPLGIYQNVKCGVTGLPKFFIESISLSHDTVTGAGLVTGTVRMSGPVTKDTVVSVSSTAPRVAKPDEVRVTIPRGERSKSFNVTVTPHAVTTVLNISASGNGVTRRAPLTVSPSVTSVEVVPYRAAYRYKVIGSNSTPPANYGQPGFNDSLWAAGYAGFGFSVGYCPLPMTKQTEWPVNTRLLARRKFSLPANTTNVRVKVAVDNDIAEIFFNGVQVATPQVHEGCASLDDYTFDIPQSLVRSGTNTVVFHVVDRGGESYFDARVVADVLNVGAAVRPTIDNYVLTDVTPDTLNFSQAFDIDNLGRVTGWTDTAQGRRAFIYYPATGTVTLSTPGEKGIKSNTINDKGQVAGRATSESNEGSFGFLYTPGFGLKSLKGLLGDSSEVWAINNTGGMCGTLLGADGENKVFIYDQSLGLHVPDVPGGYLVGCLDMNDSGVAVGAFQPTPSTRRAYRYTAAEGIVPLGPDPSVALSTAFGINASGQIAGSVGDSACVFEPSGQVRIIDPGVTLIGAAYSMGINDFGQVVGKGGNASGSAAFVHDPEFGTRDLSMVTQPGHGFSRFVEAWAINNRGQIVGWGFKDGRPRAFLLTPVAK